MHSAVVRDAGMSIRTASHGLYVTCRKGLGDALLRHYGSIERDCIARGDDLRAKRTGGGRVDEAGIPRVAYSSMHNGRVAIMSVG
jgi:hypothetical protein